MVKPVNVYAPDELAVTVALAAPLRVTVAPFPPVPLMVPERVYVTAATEMVKFLVAVCAGEPESLTWTVKLDEPAGVGVPEICPADDSVRPAGNEPEAKLQL